MMRALVYERYGPPETLRLEQVPRPHPGPGQVLVRVGAASVNSWDWDMLIGTPMGRVSGPLRPPFRILGADIAGTVEAVGENVRDFSVGDNVFGDLSEGRWGGFADYVLADIKALALLPSGLGFAEAACLPQAGGLALQALRLRPGLGAGHTVLFNGAGGGVGTFFIQLAKARGAHVTAVDRAEKREALLGLGADAFIDYAQEDFAQGSGRYDMIVDVVANRSIRSYANRLNDGGTLVVIGGTFRSIIQAALFGRLLGRGRNLNLKVLIYRVSPDDFAELGRLSMSGKLRPVIDSQFALPDGGKALARLGSGQAIGKVVVTPGV